MRALLLLLISVTGVSATPPTADELALKILDTEALYTVTQGLKPISDGFWRTSFPADKQTSDEVEAVRQRLAKLPLGSQLETGVLVFAAPFNGVRSASAFIVHKPSLAALIQRRRDVFDRIGVTISMKPQMLLEQIDRSPRADRWRAFGLVFGYPDYAVEFFVDAGETQAKTKRFVEREFLQLPTWMANDGRFVYAVPKGHLERPEDRILKATTAEIFTRYQAWRTVYLERHQLGGSELLKNWITPPRIVTEPCLDAYPLKPWHCPARQPLPICQPCQIAR
jgi:hypothetical protein